MTAMMELIRSIFALYGERSHWFLGLLWDHFLLSGQAILLSGAIGLLLGILIAQHQKLAPAVMGLCNVLYTIPAISLLGILIPFTGIGNQTAVIALTIYGVMPMVCNTYVGLTTLDPDILEAANGMGSTAMQALLRGDIVRRWAGQGTHRPGVRVRLGWLLGLPAPSGGVPHRNHLHIWPRARGQPVHAQAGGGGPCAGRPAGHPPGLPALPSQGCAHGDHRGDACHSSMERISGPYRGVSYPSRPPGSRSMGLPAESRRTPGFRFC